MPDRFLGTVFLTTTLIALAGTVLAEEVALPGGATSLNEVHGDWQVSCAVRTDANKARVKQCALSQEQAQAQPRQRVLRIELRPKDDGVWGTLVLPFGLDLATGITYQLDDGKPGAAQRFRTCLPVGCLVNVAFDAGTVKALRSGKALKVRASADGGQAMELSISLAGFSGAIDRVVELVK